jgi:group I intron endonuclease
MTILKLFEAKIRSNPELKSSGIYCIKCLENEQIYIGSTIQSFAIRLKQHKRELKHNKHHSVYMQNSYNKYGPLSFTVEILEIIEDKNIVLEREQYYINTLKPGFNSAPLAGNNLGVKMRPRKEGQTLKQVQAARSCIRENNKTGYTGIYYSEKDKDYRSSLQVWGIRVSLGSYKTLEEAINKRKEAEEYFWQPCIENLPPNLKQIVVKQYKEACKLVRSGTKVEGVCYCNEKEYSAFITTKDNIAINLSNNLSFEEAIKVRKDAEQYFYSEEFINLSSEEKQKAIKQYKNKLKSSRNKSGHQFIIWFKNTETWCVKPFIDNKLIMLGYYKDLDKAIQIKEAALLYFNSDEFLSNNLETRLQLAEIYRKNCLLEKTKEKECGVSYLKSKFVWKAYIYINGKNISLGQYPTKEMALQARKEGELKYKNNS